MQEDREQGLDGHNPSDDRLLEVEKKILADYGVQTKEELPIDIGGLLMQADEDYGNSVWDKHFGMLEEQFLRQSNVVGLFSLINPVHATDRVSMAIAGTDLSGHLAFLKQTESYRRSLVKSLNDEHAFGGGRTGQRGWTAAPEFYASLEAFEYEPPSMGRLLGERSAELAALATWGVALVGLLMLSARRLDRGGSL